MIEQSVTERDKWLDVFKHRLVLYATNKGGAMPHGVESRFVNGIMNDFPVHLQIVARAFGFVSWTHERDYEFNGCFIECRGSDDSYLEYLLALESEGWHIEFKDYL